MRLQIREGNLKSDAKTVETRFALPVPPQRNRVSHELETGCDTDTRRNLRQGRDTPLWIGEVRVENLELRVELSPPFNSPFDELQSRAAISILPRSAENPRVMANTVVGALRHPAKKVLKEDCVVKLRLRENEHIAEAVKRFRKLVEHAGIKKEMRRREYYEKPSEIKRRATRRAERRTKMQRMVATGGGTGRPAGGSAGM